MPLLIIAVSPGPVFFIQDRVGHGGKIFTFLKFRTMKANSDSISHQQHLNELIKTNKPMTKLDKQNDPRIIPFGKFIRKASIDELPQLINVLKGDMSLVGPRPCLPYEAKEYLKWHKYRFDIKPGLTGRWQVSGKNRLTFKEMIRLDIMYANKISLWIDLWILAWTIPTVVSIVIDKFAIDAFFNKMEKKQIPEDRFKGFIKRYYSDIYNVDKLEFLDDKLKNYNIDLMELMLLLSKLNRLSPTYNVAKRYFGICRLIDFEKKSQLKKVDQPNRS
jgi:lipopolysaccharide/colanic/teichoic acid biosynthesis glycosyltransferase